MAILLLKKSYLLNSLKEVPFKDLWGSRGVFTTMRMVGKPPRLLLLKSHLNNLIYSTKKYGIKKNNLKNILKDLIKKNSVYKGPDNLFRIALNKKLISISLRKKISSKLDFNLKLVNLKRERPQYKNLKYKKILSHLSKMDNTKSDIALVFKNKILETGTSNLLFIKEKKVFIPKKDYYEGNTYKFFKTKIKKIIKKDILVNELKKYDEIILIGSGKGVTSVKTIKQIGWKRKNLIQYKIFSKYYLSAIKKCNLYKFK